MSTLVFLVSGCFLGQGELDAERWNDNAQCWEPATAIVDNWYWWEYTDLIGGCEDHPMTWTDGDGTCWYNSVTCGYNYLDDPTISDGCYGSVPDVHCETAATDTGP